MAESEKPRVLLVDSPQDSQGAALSVVRGALQSSGCELCSESTGEAALRRCRLARPQLVLAGMLLPGREGQELLRRLRAETSAWIIALCSRDETAEIIACLDAGADDCMSKPFCPAELLARIRAALRRAPFGVPGDVFTAGELKVDLNRREVFFGQEQVWLTATEYHLLNVLVRHAGQVTTHRQLIREVWGNTQYQDAAHLLRVTVSNLRRKLARDSGLRLPIVTEPGVGYRLQ